MNLLTGFQHNHGAPMAKKMKKGRKTTHALEKRRTKIQTFKENAG